MIMCTDKTENSPSAMTDPMMGFDLVDGRYPDNFVATTGYQGDARYVAFWFDGNLGKIIWTDGIMTATGEIGAAWIAFMRDPNLSEAAAVCQIEDGSKDQNIPVLIFDQQDKRVYKGPMATVQEALYQAAIQMGLVSPLMTNLDPETLKVLLDENADEAAFEEASQKAMAVPVTGAVRKERLN